MSRLCRAAAAQQTGSQADSGGAVHNALGQHGWAFTFCSNRSALK